MRLKPWMRQAVFPLLCAGFALIAWAVAQCLPDQVRQTRWQRAVSAWTLQTPAAEIGAEVLVRFGVRLTAEDIAVWRRLCAEGTAPEEALRIVVRYRGAGN